MWPNKLDGLFVITVELPKMVNSESSDTHVEHRAPLHDVSLNPPTLGDGWDVSLLSATSDVV